MQFNATFNNISVISWQSVLMVEETGVPRVPEKIVSPFRHIILILCLLLHLITVSLAEKQQIPILQSLV